VSFVNLSEGKY
jgi:hypothetical protein